MFGGINLIRNFLNLSDIELTQLKKILKRANDLDPDMSILIEHTPQDKILEARDYIRETASRIGVPMD